MYNMLRGTEDTMGGRLIIKQLILIVTRDSYNDVFQRSYSLNINNDNINKINELSHPLSMVTHKLSEQAVSTELNNVIALNPAIIGKAEIPNGWQTQRLRFILEVEYHFGSMCIVSYVQGYSEYYDPSTIGSRALDENLMFHINSINQVAKSIDPINNRVNVNPHEMYNVITDSVNNNNLDPVMATDALQTVRPYDVVNEQFVNTRYNADGETQVISLVGSISPSQPKVSRKKNNNPYKYFTNTINGFIAAKNNTELGSDTTDVLTSAMAITKELNLTNNAFITALNKVTGEFVPTKFTLGTLMIIDPSLRHGNKINLIDRTQLGVMDSYNHMLDTNNTAPLLNPTIGNMKSTFIANTLPSIMMDCMLTKVEVSFTNSSGEPIVIVSNANSFITDIELTPYVELLRNKILATIIPSLSDSGYTQFEVFCSCDILGDISIGISLNAAPHEVYRLPLFADSLYVPTVSNKVQKDLLVSDFGNVFDATYAPVPDTTGNNQWLY